MRLASLIILFVLRSDSVAPLRVCGTYKSSEFFSFLAKFGFQKTQVRDKNATQGFIFGNITAKVVPRDADRSAANSSLPASSPSHGVILAVLDRGYFLEFYGNRSLFDKHKVSTAKLYASYCNAGTSNFSCRPAQRCSPRSPLRRTTPGASTKGSRTSCALFPARQASSVRTKMRPKMWSREIN